MKTEAEIAARTSIEGIVSDPSCSFWLKAALKLAIERDVVDAVNDAEVLHWLFRARCDALLAKHVGDRPDFW